MQRPYRRQPWKAYILAPLIAFSFIYGSLHGMKLYHDKTYEPPIVQPEPVKKRKYDPVTRTLRSLDKRTKPVRETIDNFVNDAPSEPSVER